MSVQSTHKEYEANIDQWTLVSDAVAGAKQVKDKGRTYLPKPNPEDTSLENSARYSDYVARANFVNTTGQTLDGMMGMAFRNPPLIELDQSIDFLEENANGDGLTLEQSIKAILAGTLEAGRRGLLVDYPPTVEGASKADEKELYLRASIKQYAAENIINWRTTTIGGISKLSLVVLKEIHEIVGDDGFSVDEREYHRVLSLEDNVYTQTLYDESDEIKELFQPTKADGSTWNTIPFVFVGAQNNDTTVDRAPLYDIAEVNIAHYRNSADFEESCFMVGQPTPVLSGLTQTWVDKVMKGGVLLGSRRAILLPEGGQGSLLQAESNGMPREGMIDKEAQMIKLGARLITDAGGTETAEAARIRYAGQNSKLGGVIDNIESALKQCFEWCAEFMGGSGESDLLINREFYEKSADPQMVMANIQLWDRGVIAMTDLRDNLRSSGIIDSSRTDEEIDGEAEAVEF